MKQVIELDTPIHQTLKMYQMEKDGIIYDSIFVFMTESTTNCQKKKKYQSIKIDRFNIFYNYFQTRMTRNKLCSFLYIFAIQLLDTMVAPSAQNHVTLHVVDFITLNGVFHH